jgi:hypothetical protein
MKKMKTYSGNVVIDYTIMNPIIMLQGIVRGHLCRNSLRQQKDQMTLPLVLSLLQKHTLHYGYVCNLNRMLSKKKIRHANFPSEISENIVKFVFYRTYGVMPTWDTDRGDLQFGDMSIEVKAFSSTGPTSFGPTEKWDRIYFLDATRFDHSFFRVYEFRLKNTSPEWRGLRINRTETYEEQCRQGRRPRLCFSEIYQQLGEHCRLIFEGTFDDTICQKN